ncbi:MAG: hypothetical protein Fur0039_25140 [Rhodocyclaceae bacterium]
MAMQPNEYPRRILLAVTGLSPQVVTETLYALTRAREPAFVPTEVHVLTTAEGAERARLTLLSVDPGWYYRLCRDYGLAGLAFAETNIHVLTDESGAPLADIRSDEDNERVADALTERVRGFTADDGAALHVSIAGGRKTMGYYAGYALSLFGRAQDRLSHVLVSAPYESNPEFYYPTPYSRVIYTHPPESRPIDSRDAQVSLAEIPFVRLREELPERLLTGRASFGEVIAAANRALDAPLLRLDPRNKSLTADEQEVEASETEFALLLWLAEHAKREDEGVRWNTETEAREFLDVVRRLCGGSMSTRYEAVESALESANTPDMLSGYFEPHAARLKKAFVTALGKSAAARYAIQRSGPRGASRYRLPLSPSQIEIES